MNNQKYIAPDGGWGWIVVWAYALSNLIIIPIMQGFGMIYGKEFERLGITATQSTIIMNVNQAFGMVLGIMNGPLMRNYGYRKVAIAGSLLYTSGIVLTSFSTSFVHFVIAYGMMASQGMGMTMASFAFAVNTYFRNKRSRAMGWSMTITGFGPIFVPHLTSFLLPIYGCMGTMLILGGLSLHSLVGSFLLQPIKWHARKELLETVETEKDDPKVTVDNNGTQESASLVGNSIEKFINSGDKENRKFIRKRSRARTISSSDFNDDNISVYGFETPMSMLNGSVMDMRELVDENSNVKFDDYNRSVSLTDHKQCNSFNAPRLRKFSTNSIKCGDLRITNIALAGCLEENDETKKVLGTQISMNELPLVNNGNTHVTEAGKGNNKSIMRRFLDVLTRNFDLDLLRDPSYVNIMLGMSTAVFAESNFSALYPFILKDEFQLRSQAIATMLSVTASSDLILRAMAPYIGEWLNKPPKIMYLFSLFLLIFTRSMLCFANNYATMLVVALGLGIAKGVRTVYMPLVIPSHVSLEKLPNASSIQSLVNGFFLIAIGPCLGVIRDLMGSYIPCLFFINFMTALTIVMWLTEMLVRNTKFTNNLKKYFKTYRKLNTNEPSQESNTQKRIP